MRLSRLLLIFGLAALLLVLLVSWGRFQEVGQLIQQARWPLLLGVLVTQALSYYANALYYRSVLHIFNHDVELGQLYKASLAITFVNQVFPSGGASGAVYLSKALRGAVPVGKATLVQIFRYIFTFLSFLGVLMIGFLLLFLGNEVSRLTTRVTLLLLLVIIVGSLGAISVVSDRPKLERLARLLVKGINSFNRHLLRRKRKLIHSDKVGQFFDEFYHGYQMLLADRWAWRRPLLYCLLGSLAEVATVYVVCLAFGLVINPGVVIAAYTLANLASLISLLSNGIGSYEAAMIATLAALGIPFVTATAVTIVYRTLNFFLLLPIGFHYYRKTL